MLFNYYKKIKPKIDQNSLVKHTELMLIYNLNAYWKKFQKCSNITDTSWKKKNNNNMPAAQEKVEALLKNKIEEK